MSYRDTVISDSPTGYWRLNGDYKDEVGTDDFLFDLAPTFGIGIQGSSLVDTRCRTADATKIIRTFETWLIPVQAIGSTDFNVGGTYGSDGLNTLYRANINLNIYIVRNNVVLLTLTNAIPDFFAWTHLVIVDDGITVKAYVNGVKHPNEYIGSLFFPETLTHRIIPLGWMTSSNSFSGGIGEVDEIATYDYILSAEQISAHYIAGKTKDYAPLWPFVPQRINTEILEWKTDIIQAKGGEQRLCLRDAPRHIYDFEYVMNEQQLSKAKLIARSEKIVLLPLWGEYTRVLNISSEIKTLSFDTRYAHYAIGDKAIIWGSEDTYDIVTLSALTTTDMTWRESTTNAYPSALVMPIKEGTLLDGLNVSRYLKTHSRTSLQFTSTDTKSIIEVNSVDVPEVKDENVYLRCNLISGTLSETYTLEKDIFDSETGLIWSDNAYNYPVRSSSIGWETNSKSGLWELREWLHKRRGKWKSFWLPSWNNDLTLVAPIVSTDTTLTISDVGYVEYVNNVRYIMITTITGVRHYARIRNASKGAVGQEVLFLGEVIGIDLALNEVEQCSFLSLVRFSVDSIEVSYRDAGNTFVSIPLVEVPSPDIIGVGEASLLGTVTGEATGYIGVIGSGAGMLEAITGSADGIYTPP